MVERRREELVILLHVIKDFGDQEEKEKRKKRKEKIKVWKLDLKPFLKMFGFGENPNFA